MPFSKSDHARIHCFQGQILVGSVRVRRHLTPKQKSNGMRVVPHRLHRRRHSRGTHKYSSTNQCISHPSSSRTRPTLAGTSDGPVWELSLSRSRYTRWIRQAQVKTWKRKRSSRSQTRRQGDSTMTSPQAETRLHLRPYPSPLARSQSETHRDIPQRTGRRARRERKLGLSRRPLVLAPR